MSNYDSLSAGISHKQLKKLLVSAKKETIDTEIESISSEMEELQTLLLNWTSLTKEILKELGNKKSQLLESRNPKSLMALGAYETHLKMAIHAKEAYEKE